MSLQGVRKEGFGLLIRLLSLLVFIFSKYSISLSMIDFLHQVLCTYKWGITLSLSLSHVTHFLVFNKDYFIHLQVNRVDD